MLKQEFLDKLKAGLNDLEERLTFYGEIIDDRIEEGLSEEEAVSGIGSVDEVIARIVSETPLSKLVKERVRPKRALKAWEIVLLVLGAPVWLPLLLAVACIFFTAYVVLWVLIVCLWAVELSFAASAVLCIAHFFVFVFSGRALAGLAMLGAGTALVGLSILLFFGCIQAGLGIVKLTKKLTYGIKSLIIGKERVQ